MPVLSECPSRVTLRTITGRSTRRAPRLIGCTVRRAATAAALLFASLVSVGAQAQLTPDRAGILAAIEAYRDVGKKIAESKGPFKGLGRVLQPWPALRVE
jgi:hypothetical protein